MSRLILASASPRRKELLSLLRIPFEVVPSEVDESGDFDLAPRVLAEKLAYDKSRDVADRLNGAGGPEKLNTIVLGADTIVVSERGGDAELLGKPVDAEDARRMLRLLSGGTHCVMTGLSLVRTFPVPEWDAFELDSRRSVVETEVTFRELTAEIIDAYLDTGEPFDKAGAYGIQGYASAFVEAVYGDYFNVVGLPIHTVARMLEELGIDWWRGPSALDM